MGTTIEAGPIPSSPLSATNFDANFKAGQVIGPNEQYSGPFWTGWSVNYGCPSADINPIDATAKGANRKFCRHRTKDINLDAIKVRYCTLPDKAANTAFTYDPATPAVNKFYSPWHEDAPKISSKFIDPKKLNTQGFFNDFTTAKNNWTLQVIFGRFQIIFLTNFPFRYHHLGTRIHSMVGATLLRSKVFTLFRSVDQSTRDSLIYTVRVLLVMVGLLLLLKHVSMRSVSKLNHRTYFFSELTLLTIKKHEFGNQSKAFNTAGNFLGNKAFCDTFTLAEVKTKCTDAVCTGTITDFSTKTQAESSKHPIVEGLILLIEEILEEKFNAKNQEYIETMTR